MRQIQHYKNRVKDIGRAFILITAMVGVAVALWKSAKLWQILMFFALLVILGLLFFRIL